MAGRNCTSPNIRVVMSVYNSAAYLEAAIDSILNQSFYDFEFIIINDGSEDDSYRIIRNYNDSRIRLFQNEVNKGITYCLNFGMNHSCGKFIACMDSDDICETSILHPTAMIRREFLLSNHCLSARVALSASMQRIGVSYTPEELYLHYQFALPMDEPKTHVLCDGVLSWKNKLISMNDKHGWFNGEIFRVELEKRYKKFLNYRQEKVTEA